MRPLLLVVAVIELSDVVFDCGLYPGGVWLLQKTHSSCIRANIFAICSLRSLFGFVSAVVTELEYLETSVGVVLGETA